MGKNIAVAQISGRRLYSRSCPICGHIIDLGQRMPREYAIVSLTSPFRNAKGRIEFHKTGMCQDCQDNKYGKED